MNFPTKKKKIGLNKFKMDTQSANSKWIVPINMWIDPLKQLETFNYFKNSKAL